MIMEKEWRREDDINRWVVQNKAMPEDCREGCLQDNVLYICKNGVAVVFEKYLNPNSSTHQIIFGRNGDMNKQREIYRIWEDFCEYYDDVYPE